jgi:hypothetical protein
MRVRWKHGFFRLWIVLTMMWAGTIVWREYREQTNNAASPTYYSPVRTSGACWARFAKWSDGTSFSDWDAAGFYDIRTETIERSKQRPRIIQAIKDCQDRETSSSRSDFDKWDYHVLDWKPPEEGQYWKPSGLALAPQQTTGNFLISVAKAALPLALLPPLTILMIGCVFAWVIRW